jgi:hypothetical protein
MSRVCSLASYCPNKGKSRTVVQNDLGIPRSIIFIIPRFCRYELQPFAIPRHHPLVEERVSPLSSAVCHVMLNYGQGIVHALALSMCAQSHYLHPRTHTSWRSLAQETIPHNVHVPLPQRVEELEAEATEHVGYHQIELGIGIASLRQPRVERTAPCRAAYSMP